MKLGVISDVHSNFIALEQVVEKLGSEDVDRILCAGDIVGYGSMPNETIQLIKDSDIDSVLGNHDDGVVNGTPVDFSIRAKRALDWTRRNLDVENINYLRGLDVELQTEIENSRIYMVHGSPSNPLSGYIFEEDVDTSFLDYSFESPPDILIMGQTHKPYIKRIGGTLAVNPGSVGQPRDGNPLASCAIIDLAEGEPEILRVDYDQEAMAEDIIQYLPRQLAERLLEGE